LSWKLKLTNPFVPSNNLANPSLCQNTIPIKECWLCYNIKSYPSNRIQEEAMKAIQFKIAYNTQLHKLYCALYKIS